MIKTTTKTTDIETISKDNTKDLEKQLLLEKDKNDKMQNEVLELKKMVESLLKDKEIKTTNIENNSKTNLDIYKNIEPTKRIFLMQMADGGGTFETTTGKRIRFDKFGDIQPVRFEDLDNLYHKYKRYFEELEVKILDQEAVDALYLTKIYKKNDISKEDIEDIIELDIKSMIEKIKSLTKPLMESAICLIVRGIAENDKKYMDMNKWTALNNAFNININSFVENYLDILDK